MTKISTTSGGAIVAGKGRGTMHGMQKVKMLKACVAGPGIIGAIGDELVVRDADAAALIAMKYAEPAKAKATYKPIPTGKK